MDSSMQREHVAFGDPAKDTDRGLPAFELPHRVEIDLEASIGRHAPPPFAPVLGPLRVVLDQPVLGQLSQMETDRVRRLTETTGQIHDTSRPPPRQLAEQSHS
jgi:hypothetical protein